MAISDIAGPDSGTLGKPVGTVWLAWADGRHVTDALPGQVAHFEDAANVGAGPVEQGAKLGISDVPVAPRFCMSADASAGVIFSCSWARRPANGSARPRSGMQYALESRAPSVVVLLNTFAEFVMGEILVKGRP